MSFINYSLRKIRNGINRRRLKNQEISVFSSNCIGGCMCNDLGLRFDSPFVNLWIESPDFVTFLEDPRRYLQEALLFLEQTEHPFPVAMLGDLKLFFAHYSTNQEAEDAWRRRCSRIRWEKLFVIMTDRDGCDDALLRRFDALPYENKVVFTHVPRPDIASAVYIPGFEEQETVGNCVAFINRLSGKRYYDYFDYVAWFNRGK